jgi:hypothetical protein
MKDSAGLVSEINSLVKEYFSDTIMVCISGPPENLLTQQQLDLMFSTGIDYDENEGLEATIIMVLCKPIADGDN